MGRKRIGELLIERGYITPQQLEEGLAAQKKKRERICNILIDLGHLTEESFLEFLRITSDIGSVDLSGFEIERQVLDFIPSELASRLEAVPICKIGNLLTVAMVCPLDEDGRRELEDITGLKVRPVLCSRSAVRKTIDRYYERPAHGTAGEPVEDGLASLEGPMKLNRVARLVEEIDELPTLPDIVHVISSLINDPNSSAADLAKLISTDGSLSAKLLKLANSAAYGFTRKISEVQHAVALLGFNETQSLALSVKVFDYLIDNAELNFKDYWNHAFSCATLSRLLSLNLNSSKGEGAFVAGLLHDLGKVVVAMNVRGVKREIDSLCSEGTTKLQAEEAVLGMAHTEVGYLLGEHWLLPQPLTSAIRYHHSPKLQPEPDTLSSIVFLANIFCKMDASELETQPPLSDDVREALHTARLSEKAFYKTLAIYSGIAPDISFF